MAQREYIYASPLRASYDTQCMHLASQPHGPSGAWRTVDLDL